MYFLSSPFASSSLAGVCLLTWELPAEGGVDVEALGPAWVEAGATVVAAAAAVFMAWLAWMRHRQR